MGDFPRGGSSALTPLEERKIRQDAVNDVLFGETTDTKTKKKKVKTPKSAKVSKQEEDGSVLQIKTTKSVEPLTFKRLSEGMAVLGCIREIQMTELIISLPNSLNGYIPITHINNHFNSQINASMAADAEEDDEESGNLDLQNMFSVGQFLPTVIKALDSEKHGYKKIALSIDPKDVNKNLNSGVIKTNMAVWGYVQSVEDHGCIISLGLKDISGFIPNEEKDNLKLGSLKWFLVGKFKSKSRVATLSCDQNAVKAAKVTEESHSVFNSIIPGALVKATVLKSSENGVIVTFNGFEGIIDHHHLPDHGADAENRLKEKKKVKCRVIYTNNATKLIGLSATSGIVDLESDESADNLIGAIQECTVLRGDLNSGLLVDLPDNKKGFVHISKVSDDRVEKLGKKFKAGTVHKCRIFGYNGLDGLLTVTLQKSVIDQPFLRYVDIKPGMTISGTVITLEDFGMLIKVSDHIRGLCTRMHLADINLKHPEKKFTDGKKVSCKVLSVKPEKKRLYLTHKRTLVNSELATFTSYDEISRGMQAHGFVEVIREYGLIVRFYNMVKGFAPKNQLGLQNEENLQEVFFVGQVVKCTVISCKPEERKMKLTLQNDLPKEKSPGESHEIQANRGDIVSGIIQNTTESGLNLHLPGEKPVFLPRQQLSDFKCNLDPWSFVYDAGKKIVKDVHDLLYLGVFRKRHIVSRKNLLRFVAKNNQLIHSFEEMKVGTQAIGFVHHIMPYGIFIEFAAGVVGLAPNSNLADYFISDPSSSFALGQTVIAKVMEVDKERKRLLVATKQSCIDLDMSDVLSARLTNENLLRSLLEEREDILKKLEQLPDGPIQLLSGVIGKTVNAKVMSVRQDGVRLQTADGANGFVPSDLRKGIDVETGDDVSCFVVDVDMNKWLFVGKLMSDAESEKRKVIKKVKTGEEVEAVIACINNEYIVATFPSKKGDVVAYLAAKEHLNDVRDVSKRFFVGQKMKVNIHSIASSGVILSCDDSFEDGKPGIGSLVTAVVKSVKASQINVSVKNTNLHGRIHISEVWDDIQEGVCPLNEFKEGDSVRCKLIGFRDAKTQNYLPISHQNATKAYAELSIKPSQINADKTNCQKPKDIKDFEIGESVNCYIKAVSENFLTVVVNEKVNGKVSILNTSLDKKVLRHFTSHFKHGASYRATVLSIDQPHHTLGLSFVGSPKDRVKKDGVVIGRISKVLPRVGVLIELPGSCCGVAHVTQLHDDYVENPLDEFKPRTFVKCCIMSIKDQDQIDLSMRPSRTSPEEAIEVKDRSILSLDDLHENDILRGYVKSCQNCGLFVWLSQKIVGRVQIKNLSKYFVKNWQELFPVGKLVKAKILSIDANTNHIDLSLRGPDVNDTDPAPPPKRTRQNSDSTEPKKKLRKTSTGSDVIESEESDVEELAALDESDSESESDEEVVDAEKSQKKDTALPRLSLASGFDWSDNTDDAQKKRKMEESESEDDSEAEDEATSVKKTKRQKRAAKKAEEEYIHKTELALLDKNRGPESAEDFDRLTMSSPNSSMLWVQYMAFYLHSAEVDKARAVADRALKTISFREEQDKFNVWIALLNLENLYGTDESVQNVFNEAVKQNDAKKIYLKMVDIYAHNDKQLKAEKLYQTMIKRFNTSKKIWVSYGFFLMKNGKTETARKLLQRSFQSLPDRKHINTILKFAIMEFRFGDSQKGVTMFESVLKNHPKRTDIWSVYVDMMIKHDQVDSVRNIFERIITLSLSTKKMKFVFKRYLDFEKKFGDDKLVEGVKTKAMNYVESKVTLT